MSLRVVWPVSRGDVNLLSPKVDLFRALGGAPRQHFVLLPTKSVTSHAYQAAEKMKAWCASVEVIEWNDENYKGFPEAGNEMWKHAVEEILKKAVKGDQMPFAYEEMDVTQCAPYAHDKLESDHALSGCLFTGTTTPNRIILEVDKDNKPVRSTTERFIENHPENVPFMVGSMAVYPVDIPTATQGVWRNARFEAWDKMLRYYWHRSLHVSGLLQHNWRTVNYREKDGQIIFDNGPQNIKEGLDETKLHPVLSPHAVFHHGCKDGSLTKIIRSRCSALPEPPEPIEQPKSPQRQPNLPQATPALSQGSGVTFDQTGWNILQNSMQAAQGRPEAPMVAPQAPPPPLQFEQEEAAHYAPTPEPVGRVKNKGGRPRKQPVTA